MFSGFYITTKGRALLAKAQTGKVLQFTRFQVGSGSLSGQDQNAMVALINPVSYFPVSALRSNAANAIVSCQIANIGIVNEWYFREIGLFANDPDEGEVLYAYGNAGDNADLIPSSAENIYECVFSLNCMVGEATEVQAVFDDGLIYATQRYVSEMMKKDVTDAIEANKIIAKDPNDDGHIVFEGYVGFEYDEHVESKSNPHNVTIAQIGAAPSGYGLGTIAKEITDANTATVSGWYSIGAITPSSSHVPFQYVLLEVKAHSNRFIVQHLYRWMTDSPSMRRVYSDGWGEWEWVNPPMTLGVEYRTTKRYDGHVVYTQMISCGKGPASGGANYYLNLSTYDIIFTQIRCKAVSPTSYWGAFLDHYISFGEYGSGAPCVSLSANAGDQSNRNIYLIVEYYKV